MPFKANAAHRHRIPRARYRVINWPSYEAGLRRRGDLLLWLDQDVIAGWAAPRRSTPGGQPRYSDLAIELVLTLRLVSDLALRQAEGFAQSVLALLGLELRVPDHTTLSRRGRSFARRQPHVLAGGDPMHLVLDSTGLELFGQGEWCAAMLGRTRRRWLKLHLGVDAATGQIAAHRLTDGHADDAAQVPDLLRQPEGTANPDRQSPRDRHIQLVAERGRMAWQRMTGYGRRNVVEATMARYKGLIGPKLRARRRDGQVGEVALGVQVLNRMMREAKPVTVRQG